MARKPKQVAVEETGVNRDEFMRAVSNCDSAKQEAAEMAGEHSNLVRQTIERMNLDRLGFGFARRVKKLDPGKGQATMTAFLDYCWKMGLFDQADIFDPLGAKMREILAEMESRGARKAPAADSAALEAFAEAVH